jgi:hypothetical protein
MSTITTLEKKQSNVTIFERIFIIVIFERACTTFQREYSSLLQLLREHVQHYNFGENMCITTTLTENMSAVATFERTSALLQLYRKSTATLQFLREYLPAVNIHNTLVKLPQGKK